MVKHRALLIGYVWCLILHLQATVPRREGTCTAGWQAYCACYRRELTLTKRYNFLYIFRVCQVAVMATITGTMFMRTRQEPTSLLNGQNFISASFFSVMFLFFNGQTELTIAVGRLHSPHKPLSSCRFKPPADVPKTCAKAYPS